MFENLKEEEARTYAVVLSAAGIEFDFIRGSRGWNLRVDSEDYERACKAITSYLSENEGHHQKATAPPEAHQKTMAGVWAALLLLLVHIFITQTVGDRAFIVRYGASAQDIINGQYYRAVTALMLHLDSVHLTGNMVGIALFGTAVCAVTGWGVGGLIILMSGAAGNLLTAVFFQTDHLSIGASTAVFGAVGFLATAQFLKRYRAPGRRIRAWVPLGGGLALLGILGTAPHADLAAHLFGFGSGLVSGFFYGYFPKRPASTPYQIVCLLIASGVLTVCWWAGAGGR
ncbi:MAG: rhomboid family intramembrane serine protease [Desulfobacterales bacterium]|nr:rhomboid family intramembrane serine protease [Desulfobacterales bacterium]